MKKILHRLIEHQNLDRSQSRDVLIKMANGEYNQSQIASFITVFLMRSITLDELSGFRDALLELRVPVDLERNDAVDIVGTGGDNKNTFNISTAACFTVAGAGYPVIKHGNYGSTSISGASNVIEQHGVKFTSDIDKLKKSLDTCNIAYLHAQYFNPALKAVAPVRKELGVRTFFNMLGPLVNPVMPRKQLLGVYNLKLARMYFYLYQQSGIDFNIVTSLDGYDEISLTDNFKCLGKNGEDIFTPEQLGFERIKESDLFGGETVEEASAIFDNVLSGKAAKEQTSAVIANAAFAIHTIDDNIPIEECICIANESIVSGKAFSTLKKFIEINS